MNKLSQPELWEKIESFQLDEPGSSFPFSSKLAKQNSWSASFTQQAIHEYKKFIYLCCVSPGGASPSAIVDEVWHLHLTYTDNYWNKFCQQTLQQEVHHHPGKGGSTEQQKHVEWYTATLAYYEQEFGATPPVSIWPLQQQAAATIDATIYDPVLIKKVLLFFCIPLLLYVVIVNLFHTSRPVFLQHYFIITAIALVVLYYTQQHKQSRLYELVEQYLPVNYTSFQVTRYLFGAHRAYQTALIDLLKRDIIEVNDKIYTITGIPDPLHSDEPNPLLLQLAMTLKARNQFNYEEGFALCEAGQTLHPGIEQLHRLSKKVDYFKLIIPGTVLLLGIARCLQGLSNSKPIDFLVVGCLIVGMISLMILQAHSYTVLVRARVKEYWLLQNSDGYGNDIINNFSILGSAAIAGFAEYAALSSVFETATPEKKSTYDSSGCSSGNGCSSGGDGGSSCGGGCGGCGGGD